MPTKEALIAAIKKINRKEDDAFASQEYERLFGESQSTETFTNLALAELFLTKAKSYLALNPEHLKEDDFYLIDSWLGTALNEAHEAKLILLKALPEKEKTAACDIPSDMQKQLHTIRVIDVQCNSLREQCASRYYQMTGREQVLKKIKKIDALADNDSRYERYCDLLQLKKDVPGQLGEAETDKKIAIGDTHTIDSYLNQKEIKALYKKIVTIKLNAAEAAIEAKDYLTAYWELDTALNDAKKSADSDLQKQISSKFDLFFKTHLAAFLQMAKKARDPATALEIYNVILNINYSLTKPYPNYLTQEEVDAIFKAMAINIYNHNTTLQDVDAVLKVIPRVLNNPGKTEVENDGLYLIRMQLANILPNACLTVNKYLDEETIKGIYLARSESRLLIAPNIAANGNYVEAYKELKKAQKDAEKSQDESQIIAVEKELSNFLTEKNINAMINEAGKRSVPKESYAMYSCILVIELAAILQPDNIASVYIKRAQKGLSIAKKKVDPQQKNRNTATAGCFIDNALDDLEEAKKLLLDTFKTTFEEKREDELTKKDTVRLNTINKKLEAMESLEAECKSLKAAIDGKLITRSASVCMWKPAKSRKRSCMGEGEIASDEEEGNKKRRTGLLSF